MTPITQIRLENSGLERGHKCQIKCPRCRDRFTVCQDNHHIGMFDRPRRLYCAPCARYLIEFWLRREKSDGAHCPNPKCWIVSIDEGKTLLADRVLCRHCGCHWPLEVIANN